MRVIRTNRGIITLYSYNYIGKGTEGTVYRLGSKAYKCYHPFFYSERLSLEDAERLQKIPTKRILLPQDMLWSLRGNFKGYTTRYVENYGVDSLLHLPVDCLKEEFKLLKDDCKMLGENHVVIQDILPEVSAICNYAFHHGLYFFDPGKFYFEEEISSEEITDYNSVMVDQVLLDGVILPYVKTIVPSDMVNSSISDSSLDEFCLEGKLTEYIAGDIRENNLESYVKRKILGGK